MASLLYADSGTPVERMSDSEAPLLVSYEGVEFSAEDKLCNLMNGCASFKLKISQVVIISILISATEFHILISILISA